MDTTTTTAPAEEKGVTKHTPKIQFVFAVLGVLYFSLAIYFIIKQIQHFHATKG